MNKMHHKRKPLSPGQLAAAFLIGSIVVLVGADELSQDADFKKELEENIRSDILFNGGNPLDRKYAGCLSRAAANTIADLRLKSRWLHHAQNIFSTTGSDAFDHKSANDGLSHDLSHAESYCREKYPSKLPAPDLRRHSLI